MECATRTTVFHTTPKLSVVCVNATMSDIYIYIYIFIDFSRGSVRLNGRSPQLHGRSWVSLDSPHRFSRDRLLSAGPCGRVKVATQAQPSKQMAWHWLFRMGRVLVQHASENIIQLIPECLRAAVGQGGGGSAICFPAVAYHNSSQNKSPKTSDYLSHVFFCPCRSLGVWRVIFVQQYRTRAEIGCEIWVKISTMIGHVLGWTWGPIRGPFWKQFWRSLIFGYVCDIFWTWCPCCACWGKCHAPNSDRIKTGQDLKQTKRVAQQRYRSHNRKCLCPISCHWIRKQSVWDWYVHDLLFWVFLDGWILFVFPALVWLRGRHTFNRTLPSYILYKPIIYMCIHTHIYNIIVIYIYIHIHPSMPYWNLRVSRW